MDGISAVAASGADWASAARQQELSGAPQPEGQAMPGQGANAPDVALANGHALVAQRNVNGLGTNILNDIGRSLDTVATYESRMRARQASSVHDKAPGRDAMSGLSPNETPVGPSAHGPDDMQSIRDVADYYNYVRAVAVVVQTAVGAVTKLQQG